MHKTLLIILTLITYFTESCEYFIKIVAKLGNNLITKQNNIYHNMNEEKNIKYKIQQCLLII